MNSLEAEVLEQFKASVQEPEHVIAEWHVDSVRDNGTLGNPHALILSDKTLYNIKLDNTKQHLLWSKKYNLLEISTIQQGYISKLDPADLLDAEVENPGNYVLRIYIGSGYFKTFKCDPPDEPDDIQKVRVEIIVSSIKAARRELYYHNRILKMSQEQHKFSPPPSPRPRPDTITFAHDHEEDQDPYFYTTRSCLVKSGNVCSEGVLTITPKRIVFEPADFEPIINEFEESLPPEVTLSRTITLQLEALQECKVVNGDHQMLASTKFVNAKALELFTESNKCYFAVHEKKAETIRSRISQWVQLAQDNALARLLESTADPNENARNDDSSSSTTTTNTTNTTATTTSTTTTTITTTTPTASPIAVGTPKLLLDMMHDAAIKDNKKNKVVTVEDIIEPDSMWEGPVFVGTSDILKKAEMDSVYKMLPEKHECDQWTLAYSTTKHGISMNTFYAKTRGKAPMLIFVEDELHHVFGAYIADAWQQNKKVYYGSGNSFLFKLRPTRKAYRWSRVNDYFMLNSKDYISLGGGDTGYGLWLDSEFLQGSSAPCYTFLNDPLASSVDFQCLRFEAWVLK